MSGIHTYVDMLEHVCMHALCSCEACNTGILLKVKPMLRSLERKFDGEISKPLETPVCSDLSTSLPPSLPSFFPAFSCETRSYHIAQTGLELTLSPSDLASVLVF